MKGYKVEIVDGKKPCSKCKALLSIKEFHSDSAKACGLRSICKSCSKDSRSNRSKEHNRRSKLKYEYGITLEQYESMVNYQEGKCAICHAEFKDKNLFIDHCHTTGEVRALLCLHCNFLIGYAREDVKILSNAIKYIKQFESTKFSQS